MAEGRSPTAGRQKKPRHLRCRGFFFQYDPPVRAMSGPLLPPAALAAAGFRVGLGSRLAYGRFGFVSRLQSFVAALSSDRFALVVMGAGDPVWLGFGPRFLAAKVTFIGMRRRFRRPDILSVSMDRSRIA